jgi:hypothetical protein
MQDNCVDLRTGVTGAQRDILCYNTLCVHVSFLCLHDGVTLCTKQQRTALCAAWSRLAHWSLESCTTWHRVARWLPACSPAKGLPFVAVAKRGWNDPTSQPSWEVREERSYTFSCWEPRGTCRQSSANMQPANIQMVTSVTLAFSIFSRKRQSIKGC